MKRKIIIAGYVDMPKKYLTDHNGRVKWIEKMMGGKMKVVSHFSISNESFPRIDFEEGVKAFPFAENSHIAPIHFIDNL